MIPFNSIFPRREENQEIIPLISKETIQSRLWRHSIGRISCAVRIPFYLAAIPTILIKIGLKFTVSLIQLPLNVCKFAGKGIHYLLSSDKNKKWNFTPLYIHKDWNFDGVARDLLMTLFLAERVINCTWCIIVAPPEDYKTLLEAATSCYSIIFKGNYHDVSHKEDLAYPTWETAKLLYNSIPNYYQMISPCLPSTEQRNSGYGLYG